MEKKLGGILTEMHAEPTQVRFVIIGIGVNVNQEQFPEELSSIATSLRKESGKLQSRLELLVRLLREFENDYNRFLRDGPSLCGGTIRRGFAIRERKESACRYRARDVYGHYCGADRRRIVESKTEDGQVITVIAGDVKEVR